MDLSKFTNIKKYMRGGIEYQLFFDFDLSEITGHNRKTFDDFQSLLYFLQGNMSKRIFITQTVIGDSYEDGNDLVINISTYQEYCKKIGQNGKNRTQAFLAQKIKHYTDDDKKRIMADSNEQEIVERIKSFTQEEKNNFVWKLKEIEDIELPQGDFKNMSDKDFLEAFPKFLSDENKQKIIIANYSQIQIGILEKYKKFLEDHLDKNESFIQKWIDGRIDDEGNDINLSAEERKRITKSRCLIFGLEYISHKREGEISSKQFDILTRISQGKNDYVLLELKSPNSDVFKIELEANQNGGQSSEYHLSRDISRAIPQISDYRNLLESCSESEWEKIGLPKGRISKCIIVIGAKREESVWRDHFLNLRKNLSGSIEILTYSDLIQKMDTSIRNLRDNL